MNKYIKGTCPDCGGDGEDKADYYRADQCYECDGLGIKLTDEGDEVLQIIYAALQRERLRHIANEKQERDNDNL